MGSLSQLKLNFHTSSLVIDVILVDIINFISKLRLNHVVILILSHYQDYFLYFAIEDLKH